MLLGFCITFTKLLNKRAEDYEVFYDWPEEEDVLQDLMAFQELVPEVELPFDVIERNLPMDTSDSPYELILPGDYDYKVISYEKREGSNYVCCFKIKDLRSKDEVMEWLNAYEEISKVTWRICRTVKAKGVLNLFRGDYRCQHNTNPKYKRSGKAISKHTNCPATLKIVIKRYFHVKNYKIPDEETKLFPCTIELYNVHNHCLNSASVLRFRDISFSTKEKVLHYFELGHSVASARKSLQAELLLRNPDDYDLLAADAALLPSSSVIKNIFESEKLKRYGDKKAEQEVASLEDFIQNYCDLTGGKAALQVIDSHTVIAICTPIMQRTVKFLSEVNQLICVDASVHKIDKLHYRLYMFSSSCVVGGAPIGFVITSVEREDIFKAGVQLLTMCLPGQFEKGPKVFMTDGDLTERKILEEIWPSAKFLLSRFHVLKAAWRWIMNGKHDIDKQDHPSIYFDVKELAYANDEESLNEKMEFLQLKHANNQSFLSYLIKLWNCRHLWASCFRKEIILIKNKTNNYAEALLRVLNNRILNCVKANNIIQLLDFILSKYESYLNQRYVDFSCGKFNKNWLKKFLLESKNFAMPTVSISFEREENFYVVTSENKENFFVDIVNCFCSCNTGSTGQLCKHLVAVLNFQDLELDSKYWHCQETRDILRKIVATEIDSEENFFMPLNFNPNQKFNRPIVHSLKNASVELLDNENASVEVLDLKNAAVKVLDPKNATIEILGPKNATVEVLDPKNEGGICEVVIEESSTSNVWDYVDYEQEESDTEELLEKFDIFCEKIRDGIKNNSELFKPAVKEMLLINDTYDSSETGLISCLYSLGKHVTDPIRNRRKSTKRFRKRSHPVEPTDINRTSEVATKFCKIAPKAS